MNDGPVDETYRMLDALDAMDACRTEGPFMVTWLEREGHYLLMLSRHAEQESVARAFAAAIGFYDCILVDSENDHDHTLDAAGRWSKSDG